MRCHASSPIQATVRADAETCFTSSIDLLQTAQYEGDLAITYACYGRYLIAQGRATEALAALRQALDARVKLIAITHVPTNGVIARRAANSSG